MFNSGMEESYCGVHASTFDPETIEEETSLVGRTIILPVQFPTIVCLCGSSRFMTAFQDATLNETLAGKIVLSIGCNTKSDDMLNLPAPIKVALDELHKRKIDLSDEILVLNVFGYIGESTRSEIDYAVTQGKKVRYLDESVSYVRFKASGAVRPYIGYDSSFEGQGAYGVQHTEEEIAGGLAPIEWYSTNIVEPVD